MKKFIILSFCLGAGINAQQIDYTNQIKSKPAFDDRNYTTLSAACSAAGTSSITINKAWSGFNTLNCPSPMIFMGGSLTPASGQTITYKVQSVAPGLISSVCSIASGGICNPVTSYKDTYNLLCTGQSNSNGVNDGLGGWATDPDILAWNGTSWVIATQGALPFGMDHPYVQSDHPNSNNPCFQFAVYLHRQTGSTIRIIEQGFGGNSITQWVGTSSTDYAFIHNTMTTLGNPTVDYFFWYQGEEDEGTDSLAYLNNLKTVISQFRAETWFPPTTPIITTGININIANNYGSPFFATWGLATTDPFVYFADPSNLTYDPMDLRHLTGASVTILGQKIYPDALNNKRSQGQVLFMNSTYRGILAYGMSAGGGSNSWPPGNIIADPTTGVLYKWNGVGAFSDYPFATSVDSLGIGIAQPTYQFQLQNIITGASGALLFKMKTPSTNGALFDFESTATNGHRIKFGNNFVSGVGETVLYDFTAGVTIFHYTPSGPYFGINKGNPAHTLDVLGDIHSSSGYVSNGVTGVSCLGSPTSSFVSVLGIVTHC